MLECNFCSKHSTHNVHVSNHIWFSWVYSPSSSISNFVSNWLFHVNALSKFFIYEITFHINLMDFQVVDDFKSKKSYDRSKFNNWSVCFIKNQHLWFVQKPSLPITFCIYPCYHFPFTWLRKSICFLWTCLGFWKFLSIIFQQWKPSIS